METEAELHAVMNSRGVRVTSVRVELEDAIARIQTKPLVEATNKFGSIVLGGFVTSYSR